MRERFSRVGEKFENFFLAPASPLPLAVLRISLVLVLLLQAFLLRDSVVTFLSRSGILQGPIADTLRMQDTPQVGWIADWLAPFGVSEIQTLYAVCFAYVMSLLFLGLGFFTRVSAVTAWLLHWTLLTTGFSSIYGVDLYAHVFLFYLMVAPCGRALSLDAYFAKEPLAGRASSGARLALRVMQLHLCISYFASAVEKLQGEQWRTGEVIWRMFSLPFFAQFDMDWVAHWPSLLLLGAWSTILLEGLYFIFIWPNATRRLWLAGIVGLHLGIAVLMGLHLFGLIMCAFSLSVFAMPSEPSVALERSREDVTSTAPAASF